MTSLKTYNVLCTAFAGNIRDSFGQALMDAVIEPIGADLTALALHDEEIERQFAEIMRRAEEAASLR
jgi:hypothetical protein